MTRMVAACVVALCGLACEDATVTPLATARSADGYWVASAYYKQWGGPGTASAATIVELKQGTQPPQEVLEFSHDNSTSMSLRMSWPDRRRLEVWYGPADGDSVSVDFQAVRMADVEIDLKRMSGDSSKSP